MSLQEFVANNAPSSQPQQKQKKGIGKIVEDIAKPLTKTAASGLATIEGLGRTIGAAPGGFSQEELNRINEAVTRERNFGPLGSAKPVGQEAQEKFERGEITEGQRRLGFLGDVVGTGAELASFAAPASLGKGIATGAAKATLPALVKGGAAAGALGAGARSVAEGDSVGEILAETALGAGFGAALPPLARGASTIARKTVAPLAKATKRAIKPGTDFIKSQVTGLSPQTLSTVSEFGERFAPDAVQPTRASLTETLEQATSAREGSLGILGRAYEGIRSIDDTFKLPTAGSKKIDFAGRPMGTGSNIHKFIKDSLNKFGADISNEGKLIAGGDSKIPKSAARTIENFVEQYGQGGDISANQFLNIRQALDNLAEYDQANREALEMFAANLRNRYDDWGKKTIPKLESIDNKFAPLIEETKKIRKDFYNADGTLKDSAPSKLANMTNKANMRRLERLEKFIPGITDEVRILAALEDIERSAGQKTGTYIRAMLSSGIAGGALFTGNLPLAALFGVGAIATAPQNIVQILRRVGQAQGVKQQFVDALINKMRLGKVLTGKEKEFVKNAIESTVQATKQAAVIQGADNTVEPAQELQ